MNVELLDYQKDALELLLYTKNTRLEAGCTIKDIKAWPWALKMDHLEYMRHTIQSSWEFVSYTFEITGVSRALTHQLVRTRTASYAQQSQRTVKLMESNVLPVPDDDYEVATDLAFTVYDNMILRGIDIQDARHVLPVGTLTNIIMKADLRTLSHMAEVRLCTRTQGEYQNMFKLLVSRVAKVHPWAKDFLQVYCIAHGICCFPNYKDCPVQQYTLKPSALAISEIKKAWEETDHVANPVAKEGRTM